MEILIFVGEWLFSQPHPGHLAVAILLGMAISPAARAFARWWLRGGGRKGNGGNGGSGQPVVNGKPVERRHNEDKWRENAEEHERLEGKVDGLRKDMDENFAGLHRRVDKIYEVLAARGGGK